MRIKWDYILCHTDAAVPLRSPERGFKKNVDKTLVYIQTLIETKLTDDLEVIITSFTHIMYEDKIDYTTQNF